MALQLEANYSKKLGLPGYSSHQFSVSLKTELNDLNQVEAETARLYDLLQTAVDRELQKPGYLPHQENGTTNGNGHVNGYSNGQLKSNGDGNGAHHPEEHYHHNNSHSYSSSNGRHPVQTGRARNGYNNNNTPRWQPRQNGRSSNPHNQVWRCSLKQKELILKIVDENQIDKQVVEGLSQQMFNAGVKDLNKLQASGLIDELLQQYGNNEPEGAQQ